jgi:hypothetical protein
LTVCGGIGGTLWGPMILCLDEEVVWSNIDHYIYKDQYRVLYRMKTAAATVVTQVSLIPSATETTNLGE